MKKFISYILSLLMVLQFAAVGASAEGGSAGEYIIPESDYLYVDGDNRIRTVEGEQTLLFRLFVGEPQRVHILTSGVNVTLVIYNEAADAVVGAFTSVDGLLDAPFDAAPGSYLLGLSGWGEVAILAASEAKTAQIYAQNTAPDTTDETAESADAAETVDEADSTDEAGNTDEAATEESTEEPAETPAGETTDAELAENELTPIEPSEETLPTEFPESVEGLPDEPTPSEPADEQPKDEPNEVTPAAADEPAETPAEVPTEAAPSESEPAPTEPAFDPSQPITASIPMNQTVSLLSILTDAGAPVNVITAMSGATEGRLVAVSQNGDWLLTPYAYYDSLTLTVTATDYLAANPEASAVTLTVILSNPDPAAADKSDDTPADEPTGAESTESEPVLSKPSPAAEETVTESSTEKPATEESSQEESTEESTEEPSEEEPTEELAEDNTATDEPADDGLTAEEPETDDLVLPGARVSVARTGVNQITLHADTSDIANPDIFVFQWQYSLDGETWMDIPGATDSTFSFTLDETTSTYFWRLLTTEKDVALNG